jgi:glycosidase
MNRFLWVADGDKQRLRLALGLLFGLGGSPTVYYGTEVGLGQPRGKGPWREESRHPMIWGDGQDQELLAFFRRWTAARRSHPALVYGEIETLFLDEQQGLWLGQRAHGVDRVLLAINLHAEAQIIDLPPGDFADLNGKRVTGSFEAPPLTAALLSAVDMAEG